MFIASNKNFKTLTLQLGRPKCVCSFYLWSENAVVTELQHFTSARWAKLLAISFQNAEIFDHMKLILYLPLIQNKKPQFMYYFWHQIIL